MKAEERGGRICCTREMDCSVASKNRSQRKRAEKEEKDMLLYKKEETKERKRGSKLSSPRPSLLAAHLELGSWC